MTAYLSLVVGLTAFALTGVPESVERVTPNDNRLAAGSITDGILTVRLEARRGEWRPDGDDRPGVDVNAFAPVGGAPQVPAPLIRVKEGAEIRAVIRNTLDSALFVHGLYSRPGAATGTVPVVEVPSGETREVRFAAGAAGTYFYWATTDGKATQVGQRPGRDKTMSGAFVVDPAQSATDDRVLVLGSWNDDQPPASPTSVIRYAINGLSWPNTERLAYRVGDTVRIRVINTSAGTHPMHLHGFYFSVDSRGDERVSTTFAAGASPRMAVTERLPPGQTFALTWKPTRPGNWLFHCHDNVHLDYGGPFGGKRERPVGPPQHVHNHTLEMMSGLVVGITVTGTSTEPVATTDEPRKLRLVARVDEGGTIEDPAFGYTLESGNTTAPPKPPLLPGPTILLKRGEPVSITVVNQLPEPTAVHWHGIELESYYDGVAGFAGDGKRLAPAIEPGQSFEARFTPPRSGTFIYHTHVDDTRQQKAGLSGPLLVLDDPAAYDPEHEVILLVTIPRKTADGGKVLLNGASPAVPREMHVGESYRLRFINVHTARPSMRMRLLQSSKPVTWRARAKDGMDLPEDQRVESAAEIQMGNGETYDFDFVPGGPGDLRLDITAANGTLLNSMPIRVTPRSR